MCFGRHGNGLSPVCQPLLDGLIEAADPGGQVAVLVQTEVVNGFLDLVENLGKRGVRVRT